MPIRFFCKRCNQLLGIASRKANTEINCPICGMAQMVPNEEAAAAAMAMTRSSRPRGVVESASDVVVYDDEPEAIDTPRRHAQRPADSQPAQADSSPATDEPPDAGRPLPGSMILYHRQTLYIQAVLFVVVGAIAFGSGYYMGRGDATFDEVIRREQAERQPVFLEGKLYYRPAVDKIAGDEGAVIIALPQLAGEKSLDKKIPVHGIRPQDPEPRDTNPSCRAIKNLGGAYARADEAGEYSIELPEKGTYNLLLISRHATRRRGAEIDELERDEIARYFTSATDLIGRYKYRWLTEPIDLGHPPIEQDFGLDATE